MSSEKNIYEKLPETPGVYLMRGKGSKILYIGKAGNLKRRVSSYFLRPQENRIHRLVEEIKHIDHKKTDTALEALILEAQLIKKYRPLYNIREKDDKSFLYVEITKDEFPRLLLLRGKDLKKGLDYFGPFIEAGSLREALRIIRRIFPYNTHSPENIARMSKQVSGTDGGRGCFDWQVGLCPGTCVGLADSKEYKKTVRNIKLIFEGKRNKLILELKKEMEDTARNEEFELAEKKKRQIFGLQHINDIALIKEVDSPVSSANHLASRVEGYDISNISGTFAVGSMVVFNNGKASPSEYKKFKIRTIVGANDVGMLKEVLMRRFKHSEWELPSLLFVDGGTGQVNTAKSVLGSYGLKIPVVGIAKGRTRKKVEIIGEVPKDIQTNLLVKVRDEAHRFAISYHRKLRGRIT